MASTEGTLWFFSSFEHFWPDPYDTLSKVALFFKKMHKVFKHKAQECSIPLISWKQRNARGNLYSLVMTGERLKYHYLLQKSLTFFQINKMILFSRSWFQHYRPFVVDCSQTLSTNYITDRITCKPYGREGVSLSQKISMLYMLVTIQGYKNWNFMIISQNRIRACSQISVYDPTGRAQGGWSAVLGAGFCGQNLRMRRYPFMNNNGCQIYFNYPIAKSTCLNRNN